jgi:hypothetical protein
VKAEGTPPRKRLYRVVETVRYEVTANTEEDAVRVFEQHTSTAVDPPVRYVGVDDRQVLQLSDENGRRTIIVGGP